MATPTSQNKLLLNIRNETFLQIQERPYEFIVNRIIQVTKYSKCFISEYLNVVFKDYRNIT